MTGVERGFAAQQRSLDDRRAAVDACHTGRHDIRESLKAVVKVSAFVKLDEGSAKVMRLPRFSSDELLLADARAILDKVTPYADAFLAEGLPANVLTDLPAQIAGFAAAKLAQPQARQQFTVASKAIATALDAGDEAIEVLETILVNSPNVDPGVLTKLRLAKRVGPAHAKDEAPAGPTPVPAPVPKVA